MPVVVERMGKITLEDDGVFDNGVFIYLSVPNYLERHEIKCKCKRIGAQWIEVLTYLEIQYQ